MARSNRDSRLFAPFGLAMTPSRVADVNPMPLCRCRFGNESMSDRTAANVSNRRSSLSLIGRH
jgi:hypothetical protein